MQIINQLNNPQVKAYAEHCLESKTVEELRAAINETPDPEMLGEWGLTEGEYAEAITMALAEVEM